MLVTFTPVNGSDITGLIVLPNTTIGIIIKNITKVFNLKI